MVVLTYFFSLHFSIFSDGISSERSCQTFCASRPRCNFFTWFNENEERKLWYLAILDFFFFLFCFLLSFYMSFSLLFKKANHNIWQPWIFCVLSFRLFLYLSLVIIFPLSVFTLHSLSQTGDSTDNFVSFFSCYNNHERNNWTWKSAKSSSFESICYLVNQHCFVFSLSPLQ